ncbi:Peptidase A2 domain-containing protein [Rhodovastum atsumiense]|nr:retroviral-like aspartic protease family protein [Rhodovastum atsumiense]CAH2604911.1 Peptidase A2 domain-containing protein [Rhodovastum atsumiense]
MAVLALAALLGACAGPQPGPVACAPQPEAELELEFRRGVPVVTARLDGHPATLILDTGAAGSLVTREAAERLALRPDQTLLYFSTAIGGAAFGRGVRVGRMELGALVWRDHPLVVGDFMLRGWGGQPPDGLLGNDVLEDFDVDLDLGLGRVALFRPCARSAPPWDEPWTMLVAPAAAPNRRLVYVPAELDGRDVVGFLDSGAMVTVVDRKAAHAVGVSEAALAMDPGIALQGAAPVDVVARVHRFRRLRIGPDSADSPLLLVAELPPDHGDLLVGVGYLHARRVFISFGARKVFVSVPGSP